MYVNQKNKNKFLEYMSGLQGQKGDLYNKHFQVSSLCFGAPCFHTENAKKSSFLCKEPQSKYLRLYRSSGLCPSYSGLPLYYVSSQQQYVNK